VALRLSFGSCPFRPSRSRRTSRRLDRNPRLGFLRFDPSQQGHGRNPRSRLARTSRGCGQITRRCACGTPRGPKTRSPGPAANSVPPTEKMSRPQGRKKAHRDHGGHAEVYRQAGSLRRSRKLRRWTPLKPGSRTPRPDNGDVPRLRPRLCVPPPACLPPGLDLCQQPWSTVLPRPFVAMGSQLIQKTFDQFRFLAIRCRWCSRHSLHTQPRRYAGVVPCSRSSFV
jgi:hypothetical protein